MAETCSEINHGVRALLCSATSLFAPWPSPGLDGRPPARYQSYTLAGTGYALSAWCSWMLFTTRSPAAIAPSARTAARAADMVVMQGTLYLLAAVRM